jgi:sulfate/thiosulfate transport system substrate-binding protein
MGFPSFFRMIRHALAACAVLGALGLIPQSGTVVAAPLRLLHVSYDPTRELFHDVNLAFAAAQSRAGQPNPRIYMSHAGSGKQSRSILEGLEADVATLALSYDLDKLVGPDSLLPADWKTRLPHNSVPYTSTIVFAVRPGNPKGIREWADLVRGDVKIITANPKTSGGARWAYLAAYGQVLTRGGTPADAEAYVREVYRRVPVLDAAARGSMTTFAQRLMGDVCLVWENEAHLTAKLLPGRIEVVTPSVSVLAEPPVAVIEGYARKHGTLELSRAYLQFLFTPEGQAIAAKHGYRPQDPEVRQNHAANFAGVQTFTVDSLFGGWKQAHRDHFAEGGLFDRLQQERRP